jgi:hypothetical protein
LPNDHQQHQAKKNVEARLMRLVFFDCESFWDRKSGYSLSSMSTESYIRDPRFELHGAAIKWDAKTSAQWYDERELRFILKEEDWSDVFLVSHHAQWDHGVLSLRYNVHPKMSGCTLAMSRLMFGNHLSVSLDSVRKHFGLPPKITPYGSFEGKHWHEMSPAVQQALAEGSKDEVESKAIIFQRLLQDYKFPIAELDVIDSIVKMFSQPVLELDTTMLAQLWESEAHRKANGVAALGIDAAELRSTDRFCELLEEEGIEIEYKDGKNDPIPAFAKNDPFMRDFLCEHDNPRVRALAEARLAEKSTLLQTRAETLGWVASRGPAPVYLHYSGAGTLRPSGGDGCLTAETQILTLDISGTPKYKKIIDVLITDLVWDGEEFVEHDGVAFQGYREVVNWDGIDGTSDHQVYCGETCQDLGEALRTKTPIMDCREPTAWEVEIGRACQRARA